MKKIILIISIILFVSCTNSSNNTASNIDNLNNRYINVGIYVYDYPFGYISNGNIGGFDYDLMNEISRISGLKMNFNPMKFEELMSALESHKIDVIIAGMTVTEERKELVNFSDKYYTTSQAVIVEKSNTNINKEEDLIGKNVGVIIGTVADSMISKIDAINIERFDTGSSIILALKVRKVDAAVFDKTTCEHFAAYDNDIKIVQKIKFPDEDYAIAFRKEDTNLLDTVNKTLKEIMTSSFYDELMAKHLNSN
ncbi:transporter substrate-binding domain-containing protein [Brachyspira murdochii]|uniref:transporter substrate-binding domain-containing protein n=1 Tax=Brachyspira murdochii TaxID=84378 RepID=UPI0005A16823